MKFFLTSAVALLASIATATPTPTVDEASLEERTIEKRATITDACDIGYASTNGGTTGGKGGSTTTVSTLAQFSAAAKSSGNLIIVVKGTLNGPGEVRLTSNKSVIGAKGSSINNINLTVKSVSNVILRNLKISKVVGGDALTIQAAKNVWVDHCDLSSDVSHDKDYYDGLADVTHACEWVTISNTYFHDHWKASLVGHSDSNGAEDKGHLHVTYANNRWNNVKSRTPSIRFGTGHVYNNYYSNIETSGINTRMGAQVLVESCVFEATKNAITSLDSDTKGTATAKDVNLGGSTNDAPAGFTASIPYKYSLLGSGNVKASVVANAGQTLNF